METLSFQEPIVTFVILLAVILVLPPIFERLRLPGLVGLLLAGVVLGSSGLNLLSSESETMNLLSDIGKIYLMFVAGLEIDLAQFRRTRNRSLGFGGTTFIVPLIGGTLIGRFFGFDWVAAVLIGSLLASHTLLAYPIVRRLGVVNDEAVTVTIGATIFTDIGALLVLAICIGINQGDFSPLRLGILLGSLTIYSIATLVGLDRLGKEFFRRSKDDQGNQFLFTLLAVFVASVAAQLIGVEQIVGAFLAGLAVNDVLGDSPVKEKVEFIGSVLFIPIFFVDMGLLLDLNAFIETLDSFKLTLAIIGGLITTKFLAAFVVKGIFRYSWPQTLTMWSLSLPQVAATLAATQVGYQAQILDNAVFNSVILMMLVTAILGPLITARTASQLSMDASVFTEPEQPIQELDLTLWEGEFKVVVPVYNPQNERYLLEMAALMAQHEQGRIIPLAIALSQSRMDSPQLDKAIERSQKLLAEAKAISQDIDVEADAVLRIADDVADGISHVSRENDASLIVLGMSDRLGIRARLFGNITDRVLWSAHCLVAVVRLLDSPFNVQRILVPVESFTTTTVRPLRLARIIAEKTGAQVTLLHVCDTRTPNSRKQRILDQLSTLRSRFFAQPDQVDLQIFPSDTVSAGIMRFARSHDLVILRSQRRRIGADGLAISDVTTPLLEQLTCSVILLGEPHGTPKAPLQVPS